MSRENVELVRKLLEMFQQRDHEHVFDFYDPAIEWDASLLARVIPDTAGVYHGHEGVRTYWRRWLQAWSDLEFEVQDILDAGDDVVALIRDQRHGLVFTVRDGKVTRWRGFPDQDQALEAVGLREKP